MLEIQFSSFHLISPILPTYPREHLAHWIFLKFLFLLRQSVVGGNLGRSFISTSQLIVSFPHLETVEEKPVVEKFVCEEQD